MVPPNLATHTFPKKHERRLTEDNVQQIHASTGNVLPIGAGICNSCRVHLIVNKRPSLQIQDSKKVLCKTESNENGVQLQVDMNDDYMCKPMERARKSRKMPITKDESDMMNDDHTPLKRSRRSVTKVSSCTVQSSDGCGEFDSEDLSQETVVSEASVSNSSKLEALNHYLALSNVSPIKECQVYLQHSSNRTKQRYINKAKQCLDLILTTICPGEEEFLRRSVLNDIQLDSVEEENAILETLVEIYNGANSWAFQRQILSTIVKDKDFSAVKELLPTVTRYKFNQAKEHIQEHGVGEPISKRKVPREKYTHSQLDHFIDFITSGDIIKDQPFGEKTLKMETGEVLKIPTVIRCLAPSTIISRYTDVCKEDNIKPLGNSTLFKILEECSAVFRKSIEGLDNFLMEGIKAFEELDKIVKRLELSTEDEKPLTAGLQSAKNYLKSGFKGHITKENMVEDHCISYALSSSEPFFAAECEHQHGDTCTDCQNLDIVLSSIQQKAEEHQWQNQEAAMYTVEEAVEAIKKWKCHILRCRNQERARSDIVQQMSEDDAIITCDWAMKFLPKKYREGQVDWFAKRGMNWHIAVTLLKDGQNFSTLTHVHIFDCPISQDAPITSQILTDVARDILKEKPAVKNINFFTDNAGCYKSSTTILTLQKELKNTVSSFNFCEAQNGKGPCDRRASHIKSIIRRYINEGNDVTSAFHMKKAVDNEQKPDLKLKVVSSVNIVDDDQHELEPRYSIPGISKLYNFLYSQDGSRMWKAYAIGEGIMTHKHKCFSGTELIKLL
ncbi:uncharacterized protein LOC134258946 [Saccostrea cucullata]|uniref:uncharacterized protein LOC134258946 n=1 Tax=Saccostrea cuccullata TaxID=36930 RepID=UPI002ED67F5B